MLLKWLFRLLVIGLLIWIIPYAWTLLLAAITALFLEGLVSAMQLKLRCSRLVAVLLSFLIYLGSLIGIAYITMSVFIKQAIALSLKVPSFIKDKYYNIVMPYMYEWEKYAETLPKNVIESLMNMLENSIVELEGFAHRTVETMLTFVKIVPGFLIEFIIYMVALFLISLELPELKRKVQGMIHKNIYNKLALVFHDLTKAAVGFCKAQIILSVLTFTLAFIGLSILNVQYATLLSILIVLVDILPILGTGSVLVPWATLSVLQGNQTLGIGLIALFIIITVIRRMVEPKVLSASMGLSPLVALISLYLGFKIIGVIGMFIGPALVIVYETLKRAGVVKWRSPFL